MSGLVLDNKEREIIDNTINSLLAAHIDTQVSSSADHGKLGNWYHEHHNAFAAKGIRATSGATKMVFIVDVLHNWVIKVPFLFSPEDAPGIKGHCDACRAEVNVYAEAEEAGINNYFAPTFYYTTINDIPFYIQARASCDDDVNDDVFYSHVSADYNRDDFDNEDDYYSAINNEVDNMEDEDRIVAFFGGWFSELMNFISDLRLNDFHTGNFGFINNEPVLIDYSGY